MLVWISHAQMHIGCSVCNDTAYFQQFSLSPVRCVHCGWWKTGTTHRIGRDGAVRLSTSTSCRCLSPYLTKGQRYSSRAIFRIFSRIFLIFLITAALILNRFSITFSTRNMLFIFSLFPLSLAPALLPLFLAASASASPLSVLSNPSPSSPPSPQISTDPQETLGINKLIPRHIIALKPGFVEPSEDGRRKFLQNVFGDFSPALNASLLLFWNKDTFDGFSGRFVEKDLLLLQRRLEVEFVEPGLSLIVNHRHPNDPTYDSLILQISKSPPPPPPRSWTHPGTLPASRLAARSHTLTPMGGSPTYSTRAISLQRLMSSTPAAM